MSTLLQIPAPTVEWLALSPLIVVLLGAAVTTVLEAAVPRASRYVVQVFVSTITVLISLALTIILWAGDRAEWGIKAMGTVAVDGPALLFWSLLLIFSLGGVVLFAERKVGAGQSAFAASVATVPGSPLEREAERQGREHTEIFPLMLFSLFGMMLFASASDMLSLFIGLEILSLPLYLLSGMARRRRLLSQEAALKYFMLGAFSSGFLLFGVAMLYGYSGSFEYAQIADTIQAGAGPNGLLLAGIVLLAAGILFKIGAVPFHAWTPDVYVGAPTPVTGFMAIATKTAAVGALLRVFFVALGAARWDWQPLFAVVAVATLVIGTVVALMQTDIKRLLAYSAISHAGFILVAVAGAVGAGEAMAVTSVSAIAFYLLPYGLGTLGAFAIITLVRRAGGEANELSAWHGIGRSHPWIGAAMLLFMLSFAGIPLTGGFVGKLLVFAAGVEGGYTWLVVVAVILSIVAAVIYFKVVMALYTSKPVEGERAEVATPSVWTTLLILVCAVFTIILGIFPGWFIDLFDAAAQFIR